MVLQNQSSRFKNSFIKQFAGELDACGHICNRRPPAARPPACPLLLLLSPGPCLLAIQSKNTGG